MGEKVQTYLDDDVYDEVCAEHEATGNSKSEIVNNHVKSSLNGSENWFQRNFGQALFVAGFIVAFYQSFLAGIGVSFIGLGLMLWAQMQEHASHPNTTYWEAFKRTLGVN